MPTVPTAAPYRINDLLGHYGELLREVDSWFQSCSRSHADQIACCSGCSSCCRGLFDITLLDALYLQQGFDLLPAAVKNSIQDVARARLGALSQESPRFTEPWLLNGIPEPQWDRLMPEEDETPCLLLSASGGCLVYAHRPMTCRLNGIPLIDVSGEELFDEWCTLNFIDEDPRLLAGLRYRFHELFAQELLLFHELTRRLSGRQISEIDLFIPAATLLDLGMVVTAMQELPHSAQL